MNDEIKEILECMKQYGSTTELALLDYITNLQQENGELKEVNENSLRYVSELILYIDDYKSRCEKAIEYIKDKEVLLVNKNSTGIPEIKRSDLLNILQNGSDSE